MSNWILSLIQVFLATWFSGVPRLEPATLAQWQSDGKPVVLIDVRTKREYEVSHIQGAIRLDQAKEIAQTLHNKPDLSVVVYCSVGARSAVMADKVQRLTGRSVYNLQGGIFRWVTEGHSVFNIQGETSVVDGYGWPWKFLLPRDRRASGM